MAKTKTKSTFKPEKYTTGLYDKELGIGGKLTIKVVKIDKANSSATIQYTNSDDKRYIYVSLKDLPSVLKKYKKRK